MIYGLPSFTCKSVFRAQGYLENLSLAQRPSILKLKLFYPMYVNSDVKNSVLIYLPM